jgi:hypothetical protein
MSAIIDNGRLRFELSNTESMPSSIYKFTDLKKSKPSQSSSTYTYYIGSNRNSNDEILKRLNWENDEFLCDIKKTRDYILRLEKTIKYFKKEDFYGNLKGYDKYKDYFLSTGDSFLDLGLCKNTPTLDNDPRCSIQLIARTIM